MDIVQVYMPVTEEDNEKVERIFKDLNKIFRQYFDVNLVLLEDCNATEGERSERKVVGHNGIDRWNERGDREFCSRHNWS